MTSSPLGKIREHSFFGKNFEWLLVEEGKSDGVGIETDVHTCLSQDLSSTESDKLLTNIDSELVKAIDQTLFEEFDYVNDAYFKK